MSNTKYFVNESGKYLGGFAGSQPDKGIEVPYAPEHAEQIWNFNNNTWSSIPNAVYAREEIARLESLQTPRRVREAVLGLDDGWLENINNIIEQLRSKV